MKTYYYYGNDSETVVELEGKYYLVQSEDLGDRGYEELSELPDSMVPIDVRLCVDIEIPADLKIWDDPTPSSTNVIKYDERKQELFSIVSKWHATR